MKALEQYLKQFPHFSQNAYEIALPFAKEMTLQAGDFHLQHGKISRNIAFIEEGILRQFYIHDGKEVTTCFCRENSITCSYKSLITQQESDIAIQALEETKLIVLSYDALQTLYEKDLFWQQVGRLAAENEFVVSENHKRFINDKTATERYLEIRNNDKALLQRIPLNYLASYLQITPETLSRIRNKTIRT